MSYLTSAVSKIQNIKKSNLSIYDSIAVGDLNYWLTSQELSAVLNQELVGVSLSNLKLRTRSKIAKRLVCGVLGYQAPLIFKKARPRFTGQQFDTYVQKSNNLQIWNEELDAQRRYVLIRLNDEHAITSVKVVTGQDLALLDTTGTLTQKYQARLKIGNENFELISKSDTQVIENLVSRDQQKIDLSSESPIADPSASNLLSIREIGKRLNGIINFRFKDAGTVQERNRGGNLHREACRLLGYKNFADNGQFPDIRHQLLEIKLQTSPTIDLGLVEPSSTSVLDIPKLVGKNVRHCDVRYAICYANLSDDNFVDVKKLYLTTGEDFFMRFSRFEGKVLNRKIQIHLKDDFFK